MIDNIIQHLAFNRLCVCSMTWDSMMNKWVQMPPFWSRWPFWEGRHRGSEDSGYYYEEQAV